MRVLHRSDPGPVSTVLTPETGPTTPHPLNKHLEKGSIVIVPPPLVHFLPTPFRLVDFPHTATFGDVAAVAFAADRSRRPRVRLSDDTGAATAEYAIVIMAAVSFAGLLVTIMRSGEVRSILTDLVQQALTVG